MIWIILYIIIIAVSAFLLYVGAIGICNHDPEVDVPWPLFGALLWPVGLPLAGAFIAARWYVKNSRKL